MKLLRLSFLFLFMFSVLSAPSAFARSPWMDEVAYGDKVRGKLVFGMANFWGGWISLYYEPLNAYEQKQSVWLGMGKGLAYGVIDTVGGLAHFLTAPITVLDIPLPHNGVELS